MIADDDDDTHFCLKCHSTILGLDNYVNHRKIGCSKNVLEPPKSPLPSQLLPPDESFNLKADDFFSSLELQSSSKKIQSTSGKNPTGILTRSKTTAIQAGADPGQSKSGKNVWIGGHQQELGHGDNQTKLFKAVANLERRKEEPAKIEVYQESEDESDDYDFEDDDDEESDEFAPPRNYTGGKWKPSSPIQWPRSESSNTDWNLIPPPSFTGGKWKRSSSPNTTKTKWKPTKDDFDVPPPTFTGSKWVQSKKQDYTDISLTSVSKVKEDHPPPTHTKGKWKPSEDDFPPVTHTKGKWKPRDDDFQTPIQTKGKWKAKPELDVPPPDHTKGKWKPKSSSEENFPPPNHTKGKWKPKTDEESDFLQVSKKPKLENIVKTSKISVKSKWLQPIKGINTNDSLLRKSSGTVQYWCSPCNRRLASKVVYERHLKSELHFKRTLQDRDFDDGAVLTMLRDTKRTQTKSADQLLGQGKTGEIHKDKKRFRKKIYERCGVCQSKVNKLLMGKHLISHYHCRNGDICSPEAKALVLDNIHSIVLQSPFQCTVCCYYCNSHNDFLQHWLSELHIRNECKVTGYYCCGLCKFECERTDEMYEHLVSKEHKDVVSVINRSVPVIIQKIKPLICLSCGEKFSLNIELLHHCRKYRHDESAISGHMQKSVVCEKCDRSFSSDVALQRHKKKIHREKYFICTPCNMKFTDSIQAKLHRQNEQHRYNVLRAGKDQLEKKCDVCQDVFENFLKYKEHIKEVHPELMPRCPHCGAIFVVAQELTAHLRAKACKFQKNENHEYSCEKCLFSCNSPSEFLFHVLLHDDPIMVHPCEISGTSSNKKPVAQYKCPICGKLYPKLSMPGHLRIHTKERPFVCALCNAKFARKNNWMAHVKNHGKREEGETCKTKLVVGGRPFLCSDCGASFTKRSILRQHMQIHTGKLCKCPEVGCIFTARRQSEIKVHYLTHSEEKCFSCEICEYKGKSKLALNRHKQLHDNIKKYQCPHCTFSARISEHLKRHVRIHTGAKPYTCPHCNYRSSSMENLRKHILATNKHPGKSIYECKFCTNNETFQSNLAKDFKTHLVTQHADMFTNCSRAMSYIAGIYEIHEDSTFFSEIIEAEPAGKSSPEEALISLEGSDDPIVQQLITTSTVEPSDKDRNIDEMMRMFVISKEDIVCIESQDTWNLVGRLDVEETGTLVQFQSDGDTLLQDHFN